MRRNGHETAKQAVEVVCSELRRLGLQAFREPGNRRSTVVVHRAGPTDTTLDVRGITGSGPWLLSRPGQERSDFTILVSFNASHASSSGLPACFVIPDGELDRFTKLIRLWRSQTDDIYDVTYGRVRGSPYRNNWALLPKPSDSQ